MKANGKIIYKMDLGHIILEIKLNIKESLNKDCMYIYVIKSLIIN